MAEPVVNAYSKGQDHGITEVTASTITIAGDALDEFSGIGLIKVTGSTGNDGLYHVLSVAVFDGTDTVITISETLADDTADGSVYSLSDFPKKIKSGETINVEFVITGADSATGSISTSYATAAPDTLTITETGGVYSGTLSADMEFRMGFVVFDIETTTDDETTLANYTISIPSEVSSAPMRAIKRGGK
jgi:hypothetical protein